MNEIFRDLGREAREATVTVDTSIPWSEEKDNQAAASFTLSTQVDWLTLSDQDWLKFPVFKMTYIH